jgi:hypothetical protein
MKKYPPANHQFRNNICPSNTILKSKENLYPKMKHSNYFYIGACFVFVLSTPTLCFILWTDDAIRLSEIYFQRFLKKPNSKISQHAVLSF